MATGIAIATDRAAGFLPRLWALLGFWLGVLVSVATNWLATDGGVIAHGVSAFPAVAFLITVESLSSKPRAREAAQPAPVVAEVAAATATVTSSAPVVEGKPDADETATDAVPARRVKPATPRRLSARAGRTPDRDRGSGQRTVVGGLRG